MAYTSWPTASAVGEVLESMGVAIDLEDSVLEAAVSEAVAEFESATGRQEYLATDVEGTTLPIDNGSVALDPPWRVIDSVTVDDSLLPAGSWSVVPVAGPFRTLVVGQGMFSVLSGRRGHVDEIPADVYSGVLTRAAQKVIRTLPESARPRSQKQVRQGSLTVTYAENADEGSNDAFNQLVQRYGWSGAGAG